MSPRRVLVAGLIVASVTVGTVFSQVVVPLFRVTFDYELPDLAPPNTVEFHPWTSPEGNRYLIFRLSDGKLIARRDMIDFGQTPPGPPAPPQPPTVTCPSDHCACRFLPAGTYDLAWAEAAFSCT